MLLVLILLQWIVPLSVPANVIKTTDFSGAYWTRTAAVTASGLGTFTTNAAGGCYPAVTTTTVGRWYRLDARFTATAAVEIRHSSSDGTVIATTPGIYVFQARTTGSVYVRLSAAGTITVYRLRLTRK